MSELVVYGGILLLDYRAFNRRELWEIWFGRDLQICLLNSPFPTDSCHIDSCTIPNSCYFDLMSKTHLLSVLSEIPELLKNKSNMRQKLTEQ